MEPTDRNNLYRTDAGVINTDHQGLQAYKRKKSMFKEMQNNKERLDSLESKVDQLLDLLKKN